VTLLDALHLAAGVLLAGAAFLVLLRMVRGPTIIDRMIASDVLVTLVLLALTADMVIGHHTRSLPLLLALSGTAVLGSVAVARYVSKHDRRADGQHPSTPKGAEKSQATERPAAPAERPRAAGKSQASGGPRASGEPRGSGAPRDPGRRN
jgi:multicomponent Na+:H+ antiporter subunit F